MGSEPERKAASGEPFISREALERAMLAPDHIIVVDAPDGSPVCVRVDDIGPMAAMLRELEWSAGDCADQCPACGRAANEMHQVRGEKRRGHSPDCRLSALLEKIGR